MKLRVGFRTIGALLCAGAMNFLPAQTLTRGSVDASRLPRAAGQQQAMPDAPSGTRVNVIAYLADPPLARAIAAARPAGAPRKSIPWTRAQQASYVASLRQKQAAVIGPATALGATVLAQLTKSTNGVVFSVDSSRMAALSAISGVAAVLPVVDGRTTATLPETVQYLGAANLHSRIPGIDGTGIRIAVLDSGIDYTHRNLGGPGTPAAYQAAYGGAGSPCTSTAANTSAPVFNSKVIGGFDFVGEGWPNSPLAPDPDPIDCEGHGTSVADIAAGRSNDGSWKGMAPGAQLYAVKVCSAVSTSCSGVATLNGLDFALDPNNDNDLSDAVDIVNLSLGSEYGMREDPIAFAMQVITSFGIVAAVAAGNDGDSQYIVSSSSSAPETISVANTQVPDAFTYPLIVNPPVNSPSCIGDLCTNTTWQPWSETLSADATGPLFIPASNTDGCAPFAPGALAGYIVLIRRGTCNISTKTSHASIAGAIGVVIDNNVTGDPPEFAFGGDPPPLRTTISITMELGDALRARTGTAVSGGKTVGTATISRTRLISKAGSMVMSSSRGPNNNYTMIKPEIGAPGSSVAAVVGTGDGTAAFSGTSGSTPVIAGAAALLLQGYPNLSVAEVKARLMSGADIDVLINPTTMPGVPAPITRIGAGEVRADRAFDNASTMWEASNPGAVALSFGYQPTSAVRTLRKRIVVRNFSNAAKTYNIATTFRYPDDQASGAVTFTAPGSISVPANSSAAFTLTMRLDPSKLPVWSSTGINSGSTAEVGSLLQSVEYDGYVRLTGNGETLHLPWHILPRRSHNAIASPGASVGAGFNISNPGGSTTAGFNIFNLTGTSPALPREIFPFPGDGYAIVDLRAVGIRPVNIGPAAGVWVGSLGVQFGVSSWDTRTHANTYPRIRIVIDTDNDGVSDWYVFNSRTTTNQNAVFMQSLHPCSPSPCPTLGLFYTGVDLNSSNMILTIPAAPIYNGAPALIIPPSGQFGFSVQGLDWGFTGLITDTIDGMKYNLSLPKYDPAGFSGTVPPNALLNVPVAAVPGGDVASPSQSGFLVLYTDGQTGREADAVVVQ